MRGVFAADVAKPHTAWNWAPGHRKVKVTTGAQGWKELETLPNQTQETKPYTQRSPEQGRRTAKSQSLERVSPSR